MENAKEYSLLLFAVLGIIYFLFLAYYLKKLSKKTKLITMKCYIKKTKHLKSLAINLDTKEVLVERMVLKLFNKAGKVSENYTSRNITTCLAVLLDFYEDGIIINEAYRNELISNISNLEIINSICPECSKLDKVQRVLTDNSLFCIRCDCSF